MKPTKEQILMALTGSRPKEKPPNTRTAGQSPGNIAEEPESSRRSQRLAKTKGAPLADSAAALKKAAAEYSDHSSDEDCFYDDRYTTSEEDMSQDEHPDTDSVRAEFEQFMLAKKTTKRKMPTSSPGIKISNKYTALAGTSGTQPKPIPTAEADNTQRKRTRVPPIFLRNKDKWTAISRHLLNNQIEYRKATNTGVGIKIEPTTPNDYRFIIRYFDTEKFEYFSYALQEDKPLSVVIRGVPVEITEAEVEQDLAAQGLPAAKAARMKRGRERTPMPMVLVHLERTEASKGVYNIRKIHGINITVETPRPRTDITQCFRCQGFGHTQRECRIKPKCVKCAEEHFAAECPKKTRDTPARCVNCGGGHPANYRGCPRFPKASRRNAPERTPATGAPAAWKTIENPPPSVATSPKTWPALKPTTRLRPERPAPTVWQRPDGSQQPKNTTDRNEYTHRQQNPGPSDLRKTRRNEPPFEFSPKHLTGLLSLVFKIGVELKTARSAAEAVDTILDFAEEICELFRSFE